MLRIAVINGPNLNLLGVREPEIYGRETLDQLDERVVEWGRRLGVEVTTFQSNHEGAVIDRIHAARTDADAIVINPGALTHNSYAVHDALLGVALPAVEVHLSDIHAREPWRAVSVVAPAVVRSIFGRGTAGYHDALRLLVNRAVSPYDTVSYGDHPEQVMDVRRATGDLDRRRRVPPRRLLAARVGAGHHRHARRRPRRPGVDHRQHRIPPAGLRRRVAGDR